MRRGLVIAMVTASCAQTPKETPVVETPRLPTVTPPRGCVEDDDCELAAFDAALRSPCCTCTLVAVTHEGAASLRKTCDARDADASFPDNVCIQSCIRTPGLRARCGDSGKCAIGR